MPHFYPLFFFESSISSCWAQPARGARPFRLAQLFSTAASTGTTTWAPHAREKEKKATGIWEKRVWTGTMGNLRNVGACYRSGPRSSRPYQPAPPWQPLILTRAKFLRLFLPKNAQNLCRHNCINRCVKGCLLRTLAPHFCRKFCGMGTNRKDTLFSWNLCQIMGIYSLQFWQSVLPVLEFKLFEILFWLKFDELELKCLGCFIYCCFKRNYKLSGNLSLV